MKGKRTMALLLTAALAGSLALSGCGRQEEEVLVEEIEEAEPVIEEVVEEPVAEEEEGVLVIGDRQNDPDSVLITNELGGTITGIAMKKPDDADYSANMMETDQWFKNGEQAELYYASDTGKMTAAAQAETDAEETEEITGMITGTVTDVGTDLESLEESEILSEAEAVASAWVEANKSSLTPTMAVSAENEELESELAEEVNAEAEAVATVTISAQEIQNALENEIGYYIEVTMETQTVYELTCFNADDMDEVTLCIEDGVAYLQYTSLSKGTVVNTKAVELIIKNNKEAAEAVVAAIAALPNVSELNAADVVAQVSEVLSMYNSLTDAQKAYVTNLPHLVEAERTIVATLGEGALETVNLEELEDTDAIEASIEAAAEETVAAETYEDYTTQDTGGMAYREEQTYEDYTDYTNDGSAESYGGDYEGVDTEYSEEQEEEQEEEHFEEQQVEEHFEEQQVEEHFEEQQVEEQVEEQNEE